MAFLRKMPFTTSPGREGILRVRAYVPAWQWVALVCLLCGLGWALAGVPSAKARFPGCAGPWMAGLPDAQAITAVAIPGTHDTMSYSGGALWWAFRPFARTQAAELDSQLLSGVRFLDIRVRADGGLAHGWVPLTGTLDDVLAAVDRFLGEYPSEVVLLRLRDEHHAGSAAMNAVIGPAFSPFADRLLSVEAGSALHMGEMTLGDLRGGILVLDDTGGAVTAGLGAGVRYGADQQWIQDDFDAPAVDAKASKVREFIAEGSRATLTGSEPQRLRLNYASATDQPRRTPASYARTLNVVVEEAVSGAGSLPAGVIVLDDPNEAVLAAIIDANGHELRSPAACTG